MSRFLFLVMMICMLTACATLFPPPGDPPKKYTLASLSSGPTGSSGALPHQLIVDLPTLYPPIDSTRIALKPQDQTIDYYADVEWADRLGVLIQEALIYSLQNKGALRGVSRPTESIQADYALKVEVRKFYIDRSEVNHSATAHVDYMAHLIKLPERHILASRQFSHTQSIPEHTMEHIISALNAAHLEASKALVAWVLARIR